MSLPLPRPRRWALGVAAVLTHLNEGSFEHLGGWPPGPESRERALGLLDEGWGIRTRETLLATLEWLRREGDRAEYKELLETLEGLPPELDPVEAVADPDDPEVAQKMRFVLAHRKEIGAASLMAWDFGRLATLAGWGWLAGLLDEEDAWRRMLVAARRIQSTYESWAEFGRHYFLGLEFWLGVADQDARDTCDFLLRDLRSPWFRVPWDEELGEPKPGGA